MCVDFEFLIIIFRKHISNVYIFFVEKHNLTRDITHANGLVELIQSMQVL